MTEQEKWAEYEKEKANLAQKMMSPEEYEKLIREIAKRLEL